MRNRSSAVIEAGANVIGALKTTGVPVGHARAVDPLAPLTAVKVLEDLAVTMISSYEPSGPTISILIPLATVDGNDEPDANTIDVASEAIAPFNVDAA